MLSNQGLLDFAKSVGFAAECLNLHIGGKQFANLDGHGWFKENIELRQSYFPYFGTCWESYQGGNHFRAFRQSSTGAWFLAVSKEKKIKERHKILEDGYNSASENENECFELINLTYSQWDATTWPAKPCLEDLGMDIRLGPLSSGSMD